MERLSPGALDAVRGYLLARWQGEGYAERIGAPRTLKELLDVVRREFPEDVPAVVRLLVAPLTDFHDPHAYQREQAIKESMRRDGWGYGWDLPHGVPPGPGFDAFSDRDNPSLAEAKAATLEWLAGMGPGILVLAGGPGRGKTHLAVAAGGALLERGQSVLYRTEPALMGELRTAAREGALEDRLEAISVVPWLIIDDLGLEPASDWGRAIQDRLIDARWRYASWARTLMTANLKAGQMPARVASRLRDRQRVRAVQIAAEDYRVKGG